MELKLLVLGLASRLQFLLCFFSFLGGALSDNGKDILIRAVAV